MMKKMMEKGEIDQKHTGQVVLVKRIIMKHDNPVRITYMTRARGIRQIQHAIEIEIQWSADVLC